MGSSSPSCHGCTRHGFALILVLIALALITALTVFFLSNVGRERRGVDQYSRGSEARHFADTAVNLVMGQINAATKEGTAATPISWASQPGMIRTYNTSGSLSNAYKLYSWDNIVEASNTFNPAAAAELPASGWNTQPALYTDLNAPVNGVYPIADPTIANKTTGYTNQTYTVTQPGSVTWDFPAEFSIATDANGYYPTSSSDVTAGMPMPVKWLYVLQDGSWVAPSSGTGNSVTFTGTPAPGPTNPIVGRMAFWTDDETSKVNVNTASEGSFWDTPKAGTDDEMQFAVNPPVKGEFQRISGHPATTSLSAIFPEMRQGSFNRWTNVGSAALPNTYLGQLKGIYDMVPRIDWGTNGGSEGGTYPITSYSAIYSPPLATYFPSGWVDPSTYTIATDTNRLYASADDLWFQPNYPVQIIRPANTAFGNNNFMPSQMAKRLFLFTANSRAPETTLFETPRVSLWPVTWPHPTSSFYVTGAPARSPAPTPVLNPNSNSLTDLTIYKLITPQETLLAFDSTLNQAGTPLPYYFQRQNPDSPTSDFANITRNSLLVNYLRREIGTAAPGMGANTSLASKWGSNNADWITLNCFDYSRSLINQYTYDPSGATSVTSAPYGVLYSYTGLQDANHDEINSFAVSPLHTALSPNGGNVYTTEGAYPALKEAAVVFYATARNEPQPPATTPLYSDVKDPTKWTNLITWNGSTAGQSQTTQMQAVMLFSFAQMNPGIYGYKGNADYAPAFWIKVTSVTPGASFQVNGIPINLPQNSGNSVQWNTFQHFSGGGLLPSIAPLFYGSKTVSKAFSNGANGSGIWSLTSNPITVDPTKSGFSFTGTKIQVDIYALDPTTGNINVDPTSNSSCLISSQQIDFSSWNSGPTISPNLPWKVAGQFPIPLAPRWNVRQAAMQTDKQITDPTAKVTGGVLSPIPSTTATSPTNWQAEFVPDIYQFGRGYPATFANTDPRTSNTSLNAGQDIAITNDPLMYVYKDNSGLQSTKFASRVVNVMAAAAANQAELNTPALATGSSGNIYGSTQAVAATQAYQVVTPYDTVISMVADPTTGPKGDPRLVGHGLYSATGTASFVRIDTALPPSVTTPVPYVPAHVIGDQNGTFGNTMLAFANSHRSTDQMQFHALGSPGTTPLVTGYRLDFTFGNQSFAQRGSQTQHSYYPSVTPQGGTSLTGQTGLLVGRNVSDSQLGVEGNVTMSLDPNGDFTSLPGNFMDGGYLARPDQEYQSVYPGNTYNGVQELNVPYFPDNGPASIYNNKALASNYFTPNREVPSPVILGTLPSDMATGWQTLNFCPNPAKTMNGNGLHPGLGVANSPSATNAPYATLPDHVLLDLFWMPVAEPYPISEQYSTAGKVNLNYAMMPFQYIQRKSALDAILKSVNITALPSTNSNFLAFYKSYGMLYQTGRLDQSIRTRLPVNVDATLKAFDYKFSKGDIFRSASQVCDMFLYPNDPNTPNQMFAGVSADAPPATSSITQWWANNGLTADNSREDPYNAIYSRITTKSNTFMVHWKVQSLKKRIGTSPTTWTEGQDIVNSELRGSTLIERYIDPNATNIPDYTTDTTASALPLSQFYKWRIAAESYFQP